LAALPAPNPAASNAALAATTPRPLDGGSDLYIGAPRQADNRAWTGQAGGAVAAASPPPASQPLIRTDPIATRSVTLASTGRGLTFEQAQAQLAARGVSWQRLETWGDRGDWKFSCSIPNPQNHAISRTYEATAHTPIAAVQAVLDQLSKER
jgi:hypothetical protein